MTEPQQQNDGNHARDRRNVKTAIVLGVVALAVYIGYFVFQATA